MSLVSRTLFFFFPKLEQNSQINYGTWLCIYLVSTYVFMWISWHDSFFVLKKSYKKVLVAWWPFKKRNNCHAIESLTVCISPNLFVSNNIPVRVVAIHLSWETQKTEIHSLQCQAIMGLWAGYPPPKYYSFSLNFFKLLPTGLHFVVKNAIRNGGLFLLSIFVLISLFCVTAIFISKTSKNGIYFEYLKHCISYFRIW